MRTRTLMGGLDKKFIYRTTCVRYSLIFKTMLRSYNCFTYGIAVGTKLDGHGTQHSNLFGKGNDAHIFYLCDDLMYRVSKEK